MNTLLVVTFCCLVAMALAGYRGGPYHDHRYDNGYDNDNYGGNRRYGYGFRRTDRGIEATYNNAARQLRVNQIAEHVGASSGTAYRYGVPGTGNYFSNDRYGYDGGYNGYDGGYNGGY